MVLVLVAIVAYIKISVLFYFPKLLFSLISFIFVFINCLESADYSKKLNVS